MSQSYSDHDSSYELSVHLQHGDNHINLNTRDYEPPASRRSRLKPDESTTTTPRTNTDFLDGLRGLAALFVFIQHGIGGFGLGITELGFGQDNIYAFTTLPFIRVLFSGGNCAVSIFFILSGYVLSIGPLRKLQQSQCIRRRLMSALIRRPIRLYTAPIVTSFIFAILLHVPGPLVLPTPVIKPQESFAAEWDFFAFKTWDFFRLDHPHGSQFFSYPYNIVMWTLPIELKGSLMIYGLLLVLSIGIDGVDERAPFMIAALLFCTSTVMLYRAFYWSMAAFLFGVMLALIDTWPVIETRISDVIEQRPTWMKRLVGMNTPLGLRRRCTAMAIRLTPRWLLDRVPRPSSEASPGSTFHHVCFWVGWYLLSQPSHAGDRYSDRTPGWVWLSHMIPEAYDDARYYRYWQTWGALLTIYALLRIPWLQRFFSRPPLRFLGRISFMLYLVHPLWFRIFGDRIVGLVGNSVDPHLFGSFWDKGLAWLIPDIGPYGFSTRFFVWLAIVLPSTMGVAWVCLKALDEPSVMLGYWVTGKMGLEGAKTKTSNDGAMLPP